ncbi:MAG: hypothetical protein H6573_20435 [Lewinellaceae bacterium]|nr:hypothetical protein [Lewinellaceae bacterium]
MAHTQELVQLMGGDIAVESQLGKGSTFTISLPIRHTAEPEGYAGAQMEAYRLLLAPCPQLREPSGASHPPKSPSSASRPRMHENTNAQIHDLPHLLLIEDNPDVVTYLKSCLSDIYQLDVAYNTSLASKKVSKTSRTSSSAM